MARLETEVALLKDIFKALINEKNAIGKETLTVGATASSLTIPTGATSAIIQVQSTVATTAIRYWEDGSTPTATIGMSQGHGAVIEITTSENLRNFKVIKETAGTTQLNITYYK
jgi:hypothetical protein